VAKEIECLEEEVTSVKWYKEPKDDKDEYVNNGFGQQEDMGDGLEKKGLKGTWGYRGSSLFG
jgi:hypothetical protein